MKKLLTVIIGAIIILSSCKKEKIEKTVEIVKDCTGDYIRYKNKDYLVCNYEDISHLHNGQMAEISFKEKKNCSEFEDKIVCLMMHEYESIVEITEIISFEICNIPSNN